MHLQRTNIEPRTPSSAGGFSIARLFPRASGDCHPSASMNLCEKPTISSSSLFIALIIVAAVCLLAFFLFLWYLHRRRTRLDSLEDIKDPQEMEDYGIGPMPVRPISGLPKVPPQVVQMREKNSSGGGRMQPFVVAKRMSHESLSPSLRQGAPVVPRDALATKF